MYNERIISSYEALITDTKNTLSILANTTAYIMAEFPDINWVGFYLNHNNTLYLGPFQGAIACTEIQWGKGVCGTAAKLKSTLIVADVHKFPGHITCDAASNSEIVIPLIVDNKVYGVLDVDSPVLSRFTTVEKDILEAMMSKLAKCLRQQELKS